MKFKKLWIAAGVSAACVAGWSIYQQMYSVQGRLDRFVRDGRQEFAMNELIGSDWKAVCFLPPSSLYHMPQSTIAKKRFFQWLEKSLGRAAVRNDYVPLEYTFRAMRIVTDEGDIGQVKLTPWQNADERVWMAFCTHNKELVLNIKRTGNDDSYRIDGHFERYFVMDLGMEINLDGSSENMLP